MTFNRPCAQWQSYRRMQINDMVTQFRYEIQLNTIDLSTRLWGINFINCSYFIEYRSEVYCSAELSYIEISLLLGLEREDTLKK